MTMPTAYVFRGAYFSNTVPAGSYEAVISRAGFVNSPDGSQSVQICWRIAEPSDCRGKEVIDYLNIQSADIHRKEEALNQLTALVEGLTGSKDLVSWDQLHDRGAFLKIDCYKNKDGVLKNRVMHRNPRGSARVNSSVFSV